MKERSEMGSPPDERLQEMFNDPALERLVASSQDYYSTHGEYVPPLARLLLETRATIERQRRRIEDQRNDLNWIAECAESFHKGERGKARALEGIAGTARRAALSEGDSE